LSKRLRHCSFSVTVRGAFRTWWSPRVSTLRTQARERKSLLRNGRSPEKKKSKKRRKHRSEHIDEEEVKEGEGEKKEKKRKN
jgi:hypothetical protein